MAKTLAQVVCGVNYVIGTMFLSMKFLAHPARGGALLLTAVAFAAGLTAGALIAPLGEAVAAIQTQTLQPAAALRSAHPAEVLRVIDGDTFEARVRIWPGMDVTTHVRLRGIDAPELHARCEDERVKALSAREALARLLAEGEVGVTGVGQDKYGGRVDADVSTARTPNVSEALVAGGYARRYFGGRRASWCG
jgi:endonuclease YncB( thermonuclease family)